MHQWTILCDFDGTISARDVTDDLLNRFAKPGWEVYEDAWISGRIGSRECMTGQIAMLDASPDELDAALDAMPIDPDFARFVETAERSGVALTVASDGLDYAIRRILGRHGLGHLPIVANHLEHLGGRDWRMSSPFAAADCASGTCKCAQSARIADGQAASMTLLIGDGRSDFCVAERADFVFAKDRLLGHCQSQGLPHCAIRGFADAVPLLRQLVANGIDSLRQDAHISSNETQDLKAQYA